jgi:formylglycine-generating enzyme required for sulfatase activity
MCLAKEPDQRPQTLRELAERFHCALAGTEVHFDDPAVAKPSPLTGSFDSKPQLRPTAASRTRLVLALATVGLLATAGLLAVLLIAIVPRVRPPAPAPKPPGGAGPATVVSTPKTARVWSALDVARQVSLWKSQGYNVDDPAARSPGGWPLTLIRASDNVPFKRDPSGIYLPAGYKPSSDRAADGFPRTLERLDGTDEVTLFSRIVGGKFRLGSLKSYESGSEEGQSGPLVKLSGFYMQQTEATNGEIERYINTLDSEPCKDWRRKYNSRTQSLSQQVASRLPASNISWRIADEYARQKGGRLPTEAQWEYAARSQGLGNIHVWGNQEAPMQAGNIGYVKNEPDVVGSYAGDVTSQGIRDMTGNVREWCRDVWKEFDPAAKSQPLEDPQFPPPDAVASDKLEMVVRGGSYMPGIELGRTTARSAPRVGGEVTDQIGFRIVIECPEGPPDPR